MIHIPRNLADDLERWRTSCPDPSPESFMFANRAGGFLDTDNFRKRMLHKLARDLSLPKLTFQVIRRTIATLAQKKGTVKDVQGLMRHSRTASYNGCPTCRRFPRACRQPSIPSVLS